MVILGLDPGLERLGYGIIRRTGSQLAPIAYGLIKTPKIGLPDRLRLIEEELTTLLSTHQVDTVATERLLFSVNKTTAMDVAKALGVALLVCGKHNLPWCEYSPPEIKLAVVGNGDAVKTQVQFMVTRILSLKETPKPDDVADALLRRGLACDQRLRPEPGD